MQRTATGKGYWMMTQDGHIYHFGDAKAYGDTGACRNYGGAARLLVTPVGQQLYTWPTPPLSAAQALEVPPSGTSRIAAESTF